MSSGGPAVSGTPSYNAFAADPSAGNPVSIGYRFDKDSIRDGSDWIAYKKQTLILNEAKSKLQKSHPEMRSGNDYRIQYLLGRFKNSPATGTCAGCSSTSALISGSVPSS